MISKKGGKIGAKIYYVNISNVNFRENFHNFSFYTNDFLVCTDDEKMKTVIKTIITEEERAENYEIINSNWIKEN